MYALEPNRTVKWQFAVSGHVKTAAALGADGTVYFGAEKLYALNPDGSKKWDFATIAEIGLGPAIAVDGTIYFGTLGYLYAVNPDGTERWWRKVADTVRGGPAIAVDGTIYVGGDDWRLHAINPDGSKKWDFPASRAFHGSPALGANGTIYVGADSKEFYAIDAAGRRKWSVLTSNSIRAEPTVGEDGAVYLGADRFYVFNADGTERWTFPQASTSPALAADGTLYFGADKLYAFSSTGTKLWEFGARGTVMPPVIGTDGTVYFWSESNSSLYAIKGTAGPATGAWPMFRHDLRRTGRALPAAQPAVVITSPQQNAAFHVGENILITAEPTPNAPALARVDFYADGATLIGSATGSPFTVTWTNVPFGLHVLTAKAADSTGATTTSIGISIFADALLSIQFVAPTAGQIFLTPANLTLLAEASDLDGTIVKVEFFEGTQLIGQSTTAPHRFAWLDVPAGPHTLSARVTDSLGATRVAGPIPITVLNSSLPLTPQWVGGIGDWSTPTNWTLRVPLARDLPTIDNGGTALIRQGSAASTRLVVASRRSGGLGLSGGSLVVGGELVLAEFSGAHGAFDLSGTASLNVERLYVGVGGVGEFTQMGGSNTVQSVTVGGGINAPSRYRLLDGVLTAHAENIGGGTGGGFLQDGGKNAVQYLSVGYNQDEGIYDLQAGQLLARSVTIGDGAGGVLHQSGGELLVSEDLIVSGSIKGGLEVSGGTLAVRNLRVNGGPLSVKDASALIVVSNEFTFGEQGYFDAVPGCVFRLRGPKFENRCSRPASFPGLPNLNLILEGGTNFMTLEAASYDWRGFEENFVLGTLTLGGENVGCAALTNRFSNYTSGDPNQELFAALNLVMAEQSVLDLKGLGLLLRNPAADLHGEIRLSGGRLTARGGLGLSPLGALSGVGALVGSITNSGQLRFAPDLGVLRVEGDLTQTSRGEILVKIGGRMAGTQFDQLKVSGAARLDGVMDVTLLSGFTPEVGDAFAVVTCHSRTGTFSTVNLPPLPGGLYWQVVYSNTACELRVRSDAPPTPPAIVTQPLSQTIDADAGAMLRVAVGGTKPFAYQWHFNGAPLAGATGAVLVVRRLQAGSSGDYRVTVTNAGGSVTSDPARLTLGVPPDPFMPTVRVGDAPNAADPRPARDGTFHGAVDHELRIGKFEVSNAQYAAFLNAVASTDAYGIYDTNPEHVFLREILRSGAPGRYTYAVLAGSENHPAGHVTFCNAIRFVNWLHNGRPTGVQDATTTEAGAYRLTNQRLHEYYRTAIADVWPRSSGARWFLPTEDEWYKGAYYDPSKNDGQGGYWLYATQSDDPPVAEFPLGGTNSANYNSLSGPTGPYLTLTDVGAYRNSPSFYGTFDQNGNALEWTETPVGDSRIVRGSSGAGNAINLQATFRGWEGPESSLAGFGFRVAQALWLGPEAAPTIVVQPESQTLFAGATATFAVVAVGPPPPSYQWYFQGSPLPGATDNRLVLTGIKQADVGEYVVAISNTLGVVTSQPAQLSLFPSGSTYVFWQADADGGWQDAANWSSKAVPGTNDHVVIDRPAGLYTITHSTGNDDIASVYSNERLVLAGGRLSVTHTVQVNQTFSILGGWLANATVLARSSGEAVSFVGSRDALLENVTMNADMDLTHIPGVGAFSRVRVARGLTLNGVARLDYDAALICEGDQVLGGTGRINFGQNGGQLFIQGNAVLTLGPELTLRGGVGLDPRLGGRIGAQPPYTGGANGLVNQGRIIANVPDGWLTIEPNRFLNTGFLQATAGATLAVISTWTNQGTVTASNATLLLGDRFPSTNQWRNDGVIRATNSTVELGGSFSRADLGDFQVVGGLTKLIGQMDNRQTNLALSSATGPWLLNGGIIVGGTVSFTEDTKLLIGGRVYDTGNTLDNVTVLGNLELTNHDAFLQIQNGLTLTGSVAIANGGALVFKSGSFDNHVVSSGGIVLSKDGSLSGNGFISSALTNSGTISPGGSPGFLSVEGEFTQTPAGVLEIELGGLSPGRTYDQLAVAGPVRLAGTLRVSVVNQFRPQAGQVFTILSYGARSGQFDYVELPLMPRGLTWQMAYGATGLTLAPVQASDADGDGIYDQWEDIYGLNKNDPSDAAQDLDGDAASNLAEFLANTDPNNLASTFAIRGLVRAASQITVTVSTVPGKGYKLQSCDDLNRATWTDRSASVTAYGSTLSFPDTLDGAPGRRFFRVVLAD
jgi:formylglycine-generating enzyme required for sulfatase activity